MCDRVGVSGDDSGVDICMTITRICNRLWFYFLDGGDTRTWYLDGMNLANELEKEESLEMAQRVKRMAIPASAFAMRKVRNDNTAIGHIPFNEKAIHNDQRTLF